MLESIRCATPHCHLLEGIVKTQPGSFDSFPCNIQVAAFWQEGIAENILRLVRLVNFKKNSLEVKTLFLKFNESNEPGEVFR